jgi:hypothetical protein
MFGYSQEYIYDKYFIYISNENLFQTIQIFFDQIMPPTDCGHASERTKGQQLGPIK